MFKSVKSCLILLEFSIPHIWHTAIAFTTLTLLPPLPQGYILRSIMLDPYPPPHVLNLVSYLCVFWESTKITAREIPTSVATCCRVRLFCGCTWRRQRTHGRTSPWKWNNIHLCVSVLPPLLSSFYTYIVLHFVRPSAVTLFCLPLVFHPPPSSLLHIKDEKTHKYSGCFF